MNRSYSKIRNINSVNYLLEQKYLEDKRNTDRGVLVEQQPEEEDNWMKNMNSYFYDRKSNKDYSKFPCVSSLTIAKGNRLRFDASYYYFPDGNYATIADVNKYAKDYANNPNTTLNYAGTYSCKETINAMTNEKTSSIQRSENPTTTTTTQASNIQQSGRPLKNDSNSDSSSQTSNTNTTTGGGDFGTVYPNVFTPSVVSLIKGKIGSSDKSSSLTQDDINKLYDAINK
jgi:hypothetical protein